MKTADDVVQGYSDMVENALANRLPENVLPIDIQGGVPIRTSPSDRSWRLVIPGEPSAWQRPGANVIGGHARLYQKAKTRKYEDIVRQVAAVAWAGRPLLAMMPITMRATFFRGIPASWSAKKRQAALLGSVRPISKPDVDNYVKGVKDGLSGVVYADDALIVESYQAKFYGAEPRVEVVLTW